MTCGVKGRRIMEECGGKGKKHLLQTIQCDIGGNNIAGKVCILKGLQKRSFAWGLIFCEVRQPLEERGGSAPRHGVRYFDRGCRMHSQRPHARRALWGVGGTMFRRGDKPEGRCAPPPARSFQLKQWHLQKKYPRKKGSLPVSCRAFRTVGTSLST